MTQKVKYIKLFEKGTKLEDKLSEIFNRLKIC